ncbi:MAG TPA: hypothetical protein VHW93_08175 [Acidimicrobiales bacterium]|jgi:hypothetical protein|nr:hypothetical protein [Acidimicrobiales bacterium]
MTTLDPTGVPAAPGTGPSAVSFVPQIRLTKREVFDACQALADADRVLVAAGSTAEARALGDLFELLEQRMSCP